MTAARTAPAARTVRTVLGDIDPADLGVCNSHDHLFLGSPLLPGQELDDPAAATAELHAFARLGGRAVVQWTPHGLGRGGPELAAISRVTGVHLVAATGLHRAAHYGSDALPDALTQLFVAELTTGLRGTDATAGVRAGLIKVAGDYHGLEPRTRRVMTAAAEAYHETGAPIAVHHELGTAALDVLDLLCGGLDVPPDRVILGHLNRFPDTRLLRAAAASGAFLALDGPSLANHATDHRLFDAIGTLAEAGHGARLLLGGDTTTRAARGTPGMPFLLTGLATRITREFGADLTHQLLTSNPSRAFAAAWP
ncbi:phosphotriesterase [Kitasatospora sp. NPDC050543]|uniref:phosphotriesterase n=1 Tax=Kitasatospora sp. NPDC050543 TaxID=3364054 RepID=UPI0037948171